MADSIRIGNQTSCHAAANLPFEFALRHGFDAFEWFSDKGSAGWSEDDVSLPARQQLRRAGRDASLLFSVHASVAADPTSDSGANAILRSIHFAGDVGAGVVNIHLFPAHRPEIFAEALGPLLDSARGASVQMSLENTPECSPDSFNAVFKSLLNMSEARDRIGMCLDMGHANLFPGTRNDFLRYVDLLEPMCRSIIGTRTRTGETGTAICCCLPGLPGRVTPESAGWQTGC